MNGFVVVRDDIHCKDSRLQVVDEYNHKCIQPEMLLINNRPSVNQVFVSSDALDIRINTVLDILSVRGNESGYYSNCGEG